MKRFLLFYNNHMFKPAKGWSDFRGSFDTVSEAQQAALQSGCAPAHIVDAITGRVVSRYKWNDDYYHPAHEWVNYE